MESKQLLQRDQFAPNRILKQIYVCSGQSSLWLGMDADSEELIKYSIGAGNSTLQLRILSWKYQTLLKETNI